MVEENALTDPEGNSAGDGLVADHEKITSIQSKGHKTDSKDPQNIDSLINNPDNSSHGQQSSTNAVFLESLPTERSQSAEMIAHSEVSNGINDEKKALDKMEDNSKIQKETELASSRTEITTHDQDLLQLGEEKSNEIVINSNEDKQNELQSSEKNVFTHNQDLIGIDNEIEDLLREDENKLALEAELAQFTEDLNKKPSTPLSISSDEDIADVIDEINDGNNEAVKYESEFLTRRIMESKENETYLKLKLAEKEREVELAQSKIKDLQLRLIRFSKDDEAKDKRVASLEKEIAEANKRIEEILNSENQFNNRSSDETVNNKPVSVKVDNQGEESKTCIIL